MYQTNFSLKLTNRNIDNNYLSTNEKHCLFDLPFLKYKF